MPSPSLLYILGPKQSTENMLRVILGNAVSILKVGIFFSKDSQYVQQRNHRELCSPPLKGSHWQGYFYFSTVEFTSVHFLKNQMPA